MDKISLEIAKFFAALISTSVTVILYFDNKQKKAYKALQERQDRINEMNQDKLTSMDRKSAEDMATMREDQKRLREKVDSDRIDYKESLRQITDYMYNRPR